MTDSILKQDLNAKKFKRTLFIRTKHNLQILGVIPLYQVTKEHLNNC